MSAASQLGNSRPSGNMISRLWGWLPLRFKITSILLPTLLPLLAVVAVGYWSGRDSTLTASAGIAGLIADDGSHEIGAFLLARHRQFEQWMADDIYGAAIAFDAVKELEKTLDGMIKKDPAFAARVLTDLHGKILQAVGATGQTSIGKDLAEWKLHRAGTKLDTFIAKSPTLSGQRTLIYCFETRADDQANGTLIAFILQFPDSFLSQRHCRLGLYSPIALVGHEQGSGPRPTSRIRNGTRS